MAGTLLAEIKRAAARLDGHARQTPLEHSPGLSALSGAEVWLKCEHLQHTGSFKFRGAYNCIAGLGDKARAGVIAASSGNHGMAVARAAGEAGVSATVCLPASVSPLKKAAIEALGAAIHMVEGDALAAETRARKMADRQGIPFISPYNDLRVMAGQGTIGLEIAAVDMAFDGLFAAVGGGGMIGGIGAVLSRGLPGCRLGLLAGSCRQPSSLYRGRPYYHRR